MPQTPRLTFDKGCFILYDLHPKNISFPKLSDMWQSTDNKIYRTRDLKSASEFWHLADPVAKKVFSRAFNFDYKPVPLPELSFLDSHQRDGVSWIMTRKRSYLAHAPGAGKTAQAIVASCLCNEPGQTLLIVPPSLATNWEREIYKFTEPMGVWPTIGTIPTSNRKDDMPWRADFIICPDSMLTKAWVYEALLKLKFKFIAVDEASRFKEPASARTKALFGGKRGGTDGGYRFKGLFQEAHHVVLLDGSPMPNRPMELWAPIYALDPQAIDCMDQTDFGFKFCGATMNRYGQWEFRHASNEAELHRRLRKRFMHVVEEDKLNHSERLRSIVVLNKDVRSPEHKEWERTHLKALKFSDLNESMNQGEIARYRQELGISKVPWLSSYIFDRLSSSKESILVFVWHRSVAEELKQRLSKFKPALVIGGTDNDIREKYFDEFQRGNRRLIIGNIQAMGRGHNLQRADRVIFGEYSWTDELNKQCEKRASRRGRDKDLPVRCEYVVAPNSMDEVILNSVFTKAQRVKRVIG